jgi:hypothetical protein
MLLGADGVILHVAEIPPRLLVDPRLVDQASEVSSSGPVARWNSITSRAS